MLTRGLFSPEDDTPHAGTTARRITLAPSGGVTSYSLVILERRSFYFSPHWEAIFVRGIVYFLLYFAPNSKPNPHFAADCDKRHQQGSASGEQR
jgi:hypothetical protein